MADVNLANTNVGRSKPRKVFLYNKADYDSMSAALDSYFPTFETLAEELSIEDLWRVFKNKITELTNCFVPSAMLTSKRARDKPWVSRQLRSLIQKKRRAFLKYRSTQLAAHLAKLSELTAHVKTSIHTAKQQYFQAFEERVKNNPKEFWRYVRSNAKSDISVPPLNHDDSVVQSDTDKAQLLNSFFYSVFNPPAQRDVSFDAPFVTNEMPPITLQVEGIRKLLNELDVSKATGPDNISPCILRSCSGVVCLYFYVLFEKSLDTSSLPSDWKLGRVVPIHKGGPRNVVTNYRPISLTSIACKVIEHVLYTGIIHHVNASGILHSSQHGFRQGYSCVTQLTEFVHELAGALDGRDSVDCIFLDFSKAFDVVSHDLLIAKLHGYKIDKKVVYWIREYLSLRKQYVVLNGCQSEFADVTSGVPQGSVLGPLLFMLYLNDIVGVVSSPMRLFADDCVVYRKIRASDDVDILQADINAITDWCKLWEMNINFKKTVHIPFTRRRVPSLSTYTINDEPLTVAYEYKYLGVFLTSTLSWSKHIDYTVSKASRMLGFLARNFKPVPRSLKERLYFSHVRSILEYACTIWDPHTAVQIIKLEKVQNRAARFVLNNYDRRLSMTRAKQSLGWKELSFRRKNLRLKFFNNIFHCRTGIDRNAYLHPPDYISQRKDHVYKVKEFRCKSDVYMNSFFPKTIRDWNGLPASVVNIVPNDMFYSTLTS